MKKKRKVVSIMTTDEAIEKAKNEDINVGQVIAAGLVADAINKLAESNAVLADAKKRQVDMYEGMMEKFAPVMDMYVDMISKMSPAIDASMQAMKDEMEGESWKHGTDKE